MYDDSLEDTSKSEDIVTSNSKEKELSSAEKLANAKSQNADTKAWLQISETKIDNPVLQAENNDYYLRRNEQKLHDVYGCYFADMYANVSSRDSLMQNTVIYGHTTAGENPETGLKFTTLFNYLDKDYLKQNPYITLTIGEDDLLFEIFAVFYSDINFYYINPTPSNMGFDAFMQDVNSRNEYIFSNTTVTSEDKLLTLSGCSYKYDTNDKGNHRFVVMGKLVNEKRSDISVEIKPVPQRPDPSV